CMFIQTEDGIRYRNVTGVQTCALPIFGYLANRYGFHQVAINGLSNQEPSQKELTEIIDNIKQENIPYILYEPNVTSTVTDVIKDETKTEPIYFNNLETLSPKYPRDATYQSMMDKNIETLDQALNDK